jgi:hypothetical protein
MIIFGQINECFTQFQAGDRLEALFGVSILEDKGHALNELWDIVYQMSSAQSKDISERKQTPR